MFFLFKQKTAYEMRISDWSSDVCSSDLLLQAVEVDREGQVLAGLEEVDLLFQQEGVGAEVDEALALHQFPHDLRHLLVDQRLAAGDRDDGCAALLRSLDAFRHRQPPVQRSAERCVGKECVSLFGSPCAPYHEQKNAPTCT